jgi:hypothetical protein
MDNATTTVISFCGFAVSILTAVVAAINHKRIRSSCCGKEIIASLDIESTTPTRAISPGVPQI